MYEYDNLIIPFIEKVTSYNWLDELLNSNPLAFEEICPPITLADLEYRKLIVADLNNNPHFHEIYKIIENDCQQIAISDNYMKKVLVVLKIVYNELRGN